MSNPRVVAEISAVDHASAKIQEVMQAALKAQSRFGKGSAGLLRQAKEAQTALVAAQNSHAAAIERANAGLIKTRDLLKGMAAYKLGEIAVGGLKEAANIQAEIARMRAAGINQNEISAIDNQAAHIMGDVQNVSRSAILETARELHAILLKPEKETAELLPAIIKAKQAMESMGGVHGEATSITPVIRAFESLGLTQNPERFATAMESFTKAQQIFGSHFLNPDTYREAVLNAGSNAQFWSDDFRNRYFPTLVQELQGRAGTGLGMLAKEITGTMNDSHGALKEMLRLGLVDKNGVDYLKSGEAKALKPGQHVEGFETMVRDPLAWIRNVLKPSLERAGITKDEDIASEIRKLFPNKSASSIVAKVLEQLPQLDKDAANIAGAAGFNGVNPFDPNFAAGALGTSARGLAATLVEPIMGDLAHVMSVAASEISKFGATIKDFYDKNPTIGKVAAGGAILTGGALSLGALQAIVNKLSGASAIRASALQLDAAAVALDKAAVALEASATSRKIAGAATGAAAAEGAAVGAATKVEGATSGVVAGEAAAGRGAMALMGRAGIAGLALDAFIETLQALDNGGYLKAASDAMRALDKRMGFDPDGFKPQIQADQKAQGDAMQQAADLWKRWFTPAPKSTPASATPVPVKLVPTGFEGEKVQDAFAHAKYLPPQQHRDIELETLRTRAYQTLDQHGPIHIDPISVSGTLSGDITGSANIRAVVDVNASPMLDARLRSLEAETATLKGQAKANVGSSMAGPNAPKSSLHDAGVSYHNGA